MWIVLVEMDTRTQTISEMVALDRERLQGKFIHEAIREWDSMLSKEPLYYPAFIQIVVSQKWVELIQSN